MPARIIDLSSRAAEKAKTDDDPVPLPTRRPLRWDVTITAMAVIRNGPQPICCAFTSHIAIDPDDWSYELTIEGECGEDRAIRVMPRTDESPTERRERMRRVLRVSDVLGYCLGVPA